MLIFIVGHHFLLLQAKNCCCHRKVIVACKWPFWATVGSQQRVIPVLDQDNNRYKHSEVSAVVVRTMWFVPGSSKVHGLDCT